MKLEIGDKLTGNGLSLTLVDRECTTPPGSCGGDEWLYHWKTPQDRSHVTTCVELAGLLSDGAKIEGGMGNI